MIRRFVNVVAENYKTGLCSLHRLDASKHLFYQTRIEAQVVPPLLQAQANDTAAASDDETTSPECWSQELPSPTVKWGSCGSNLEFFGLVSPGCSDARILRITEAGNGVLYYADSDSSAFIPSLNEFEGPVSLSVSVARTCAKEEDLYLMHGGTPVELISCFHVLRFGNFFTASNFQNWDWQALPLPPFVSCDNPQHKLDPVVRSCTLVDGGRTICLSSEAEEGIDGTYCFDTRSREWRRAGGWVLPFDGRAEYVPDLDVWVGLSLSIPGHLCATSGISDLLMDPKQLLCTIVWQDRTHMEGAAVIGVNLLKLGPGRFAIAKVCKAAHNTGEPAGCLSSDEDEFVILTGVEICRSGSDDNDPQWLKMFQHKSIRYMCANNNTIRSVL